MSNPHQVTKKKKKNPNLHKCDRSTSTGNGKYWLQAKRKCLVIDKDV